MPVLFWSYHHFLLTSFPFLSNSGTSSGACFANKERPSAEFMATRRCVAGFTILPAILSALPCFFGGIEIFLLYSARKNSKPLLAQVLRRARLEHLLTAHPRTGVVAPARPCLHRVLRVLDAGHAGQQLDKVGHGHFHDGTLARHADAFKAAVVGALDQRALHVGVRVPGAQVRATLEDAREELDVAPVAGQLVGVVAQRGVAVDNAAVGQTDAGARTQVRVVILKVNGRALGRRTLDGQVLVHRPSGDTVVLDILALFGAVIGPVSASIQKCAGSHVACLPIYHDM